MKNLKNRVLNIAAKTNKVVQLVGERGEGKTQFFKDLAKELNKTISIVNLSAIESMDLVGMPRIESGKTVYSRPDFLDSDFIVFDEIDRLRDKSVESVLLSLFQDRAINGNALKAETMLFAAGNGNSDKYNTVELCEALQDRIVTIPFQYSISEKVNYLKTKHGADNPLVRFVETKKEVFASLSSRTIDAACAVSFCIDSTKDILGAEIGQTYEIFTREGMATWRDLASGKVDLESIGVITRGAMIKDILNHLPDIDKESSDEGLNNINSFLLDASAEEKTLFFTALRDTVIENESLRPTIISLNEKKFFKGFKTYLKKILE